jgi:hypothetical protein
MMKQLTGGQPVNHKENNVTENKSPTKKQGSNHNIETNGMKKGHDEHQIDQNDPEYIRNKRLENIKKRAEDNYQQDDSIDDEADEQMPVTERGKMSSRKQPAATR